VERPYPATAEHGRRAGRHGLAGSLRRLGLLLGHICLSPFRHLPRATIGNQITLLSLVTTTPFLLLLIVWSIQDQDGAGRTVAGLIWATIAAVGLGVLSHRRLSVPIVQLATTAQRIGQGDFTVRTPFQRADELGELAEAMNAMTVGIQTLTGELRDARDHVVQTITEVGRLASSGVDTDEIWPLLADIARRLTAADGSALYLLAEDGALRLGATAGLTVWPARGDLATRLAGEGRTGRDARPVWADRRMAVPLAFSDATAAVLEVYRTTSPFPRDSERLLAVFARQAELTIERAHLRRQAAEAYAWEQTSRVQGEFIAMASHELRHPVMSLRSYAEALRRTEGELTAEERRYCLERVEHLSGRLGDIVRNLLSASRIRSGQLRVDLTTVDLHSVVTGIASDMRRRDPGCAILEELPERLPAVRADPVCLEEILMNLLSNAVRWSPIAGRVWIRAEAALADGAPRVRLQVRDEGPGLSREQQSRLFQRFVRFDGDQAAGREPAGLGLGLFICQSYARLMQGSIWVTSDVGQGATFTVDLPAAVPADSGGCAGLS
jgi:signal transduction histidine kinase/HAMP domain-containing protein